MTPSVKTDREGIYSFMRHKKSVWFLAWKEKGDIYINGEHFELAITFRKSQL